MLVDVHTHLTFDDFQKDLDEVIDRARKVNVKYILCSGVNHSTNLQVLELAKKYDIPVIEDCAHSLGAEYKGKKVGSIGTASFFSSDHTKIISHIKNASA